MFAEVSVYDRGHSLKKILTESLLNVVILSIESLESSGDSVGALLPVDEVISNSHAQGCV